jgi:hypothetical protein
MTTSTSTRSPHPATAARSMTLVWIDAHEAIVARWIGDGPVVRRTVSEVPDHVRATGQVRHRPGVHHGGGAGEAAAEQHRLEHLARYVEGVAKTLDPDDDLVILGPGSVREHLEREVRAHDRGRPRPRSVTCEASPRRTERQLVARLRTLVGVEPPRRVVGTGSDATV